MVAVYISTFIIWVLMIGLALYIILDWDIDEDF